MSYKEPVFRELTVKVRYVTDDIPHLERIKVGDAIDVRAAEDVHLHMLEFAKIPLGFACKIPEGYTALLLPRSSTFGKYGIIETNSAGVIDSSFAGNNDLWQMPVVALREDVFIPKGERIAQFLLIPQINFNLETVDHLEDADRGGFGSTGTN